MSFSDKFVAPLEERWPWGEDQSTLSNYQDVRTDHLDLDWTIHWDQKIIVGGIQLKMTATKDIDHVLLDSSYLDIKKVYAFEKEVKWSLGKKIGTMGEGLKIVLDQPLKAGQKVVIEIKYSSTKDCTALGWLNPVQTKSGKFPYLYSQSQAIHARSMFPCQDTPAIKASYCSTIRSSLPVLMSGLRVSPPPEQTPAPGTMTEYSYRQPCAIPSYLIAIASGELVYRPFDSLSGKEWKTGCWAEPDTIEAAYWEFKKDTANFVAAAEKYVSNYRFGVYDILFLPDSFPYGGMENACLTFATPSVIAGDRSAVDVCAHEISHSWFGNGIGCASWCHFWLNESWTTYLERLLVRETEGEAARQLSFLIGRKGLKEDLARFEEEGNQRFQKLVTEYAEHEVSDDGYSQVAYEKGANLLLHIERLVGGLEVFVPYMKDYDRTFTGTSITTQQWYNHLFHYFGSVSNGKELVEKLRALDWDKWLHGSGPDLCVDVQYDDSLSKQCIALADKWDQERDSDYSSFSPKDVSSFITSQKNVFLDALDTKKSFPPKAIAAIGKTYEFDSSENAEIRNRFYRIALRSGPEYAKEAASWVTNKGRMKFCRPTYRGIFAQDPELAIRTFKAHMDFYHPIARKMIAADLGLEKS